MPYSDSTKRVWTTIPSNRTAELDARADEEDLNRAEWIRKTLFEALDGKSESPDSEAVHRGDLVSLATWIDRRIQAQEAKQKCDVNAVLSFIRITLEQIMFAEVFARSAATAYLPEGLADAEQLIEEYQRDVHARCEEIIEDVNRIVGEARDEGRRRAEAADASLDGFKAGLEEL